MPCLLRFDRWLTATFDDPGDVLGRPGGSGRAGRRVPPLGRRPGQPADRRRPTAGTREAGPIPA